MRTGLKDKMVYGVDESTITDNYTGNSGSIYNQAVALGGWDFETVWTTDPTPLLR